MVLLEGEETFRRQGLVEGRQITGDVLSKWVLGPVPFFFWPP
jgi:hypothetical protein